MSDRATLILGGARSGKSRLAERLAAASGRRVIYIATAAASDEVDAEMRERIAAHRARRPAQWRTVEAASDLARVLRREAAPDTCLLVDCLTLWLSQALCAAEEGSVPDPWPAERAALFETLPTLPGELLLVSNETGLGVVPMGRLSRRFVDEAGWLHQDLAAACGRVVLTVAGLPHCLKGEISGAMR